MWIPQVNSIKLEGLKPKLLGKVKFDNVVFTYPTRPEHPILSGLNFEIQPGQTVAIVGHSGSGKSTIAQILMRFYDPDQGNITIDDYPIQKLDTNYLRDQVLGLVSQEPVLFAASIMDNIRYGKPNATDEQVIAAAKMANANEFIQEFPDKYNTFAGERGAALSGISINVGGQKQRIAIARALLKNPQILLLDEATSALDAHSEYLVGLALDKIIQGRTTITIAHRLSTIQKADLIIVLNEGQVVEQGSFDELVSQPNGVFKDLVSKQISP